MRTFIVWVENHEDEVEMPDDASEQECEAACEAVVDRMMSQIDAGWDETTEVLKESK